MSQPPGLTRFDSQFKSVFDAAQRQGLTLEKGWTQPEGERLGLVPDFVIEHRTVLCRSGDVPFMTENSLGYPLDSSRNTRGDAGVKVLTAGPARPDETTLDAVRRINGVWQRRNGADVVAPNHLVSICSNATLCPADEPVPAPRWPMSGPRPPQRQDNAGLGVRVWVIDTGLIDAEHPERLYPWLAESPRGQQQSPGIGGELQTSAGPPEPIAEYRGHGTFIAGVLKSVAPGAEVTVKNMLTCAGAILELNLGDALISLLDGSREQQPHIISLSAGTQAFEDLLQPTFEDSRQALRGLNDLMQLLERSQILLVAAAGNDGGTTKFWPAAYAADRDGVLSVGALREDGYGRACFSNFGDWVNVYAPGERLVNAFDTGTYRYIDARAPRCIHYSETPLYQPCTCTDRPDKDDKRSFDGMAEWSGTSFATPIVAGRVAAYMSEHPVTAREAAAKLREQAEQRQITEAADGVTLPVLWPR